MPTSQIYNFAEYRLDSLNACLHKHNQAIPLPPKALTMLAYLIERRGRLVTKDELLKAVWEGRYVSEGVLKTTMQLLRQALDDDPKAPRFLETVHRRGYRFRAEAAVSTPLDPTYQGQTHPEPASLFGRERELQRLRSSLALALANQPQLVFVTGQAGIGKTTLIEHFLAGNAAHVATGHGQCVEQYGQSEPYLPILDILNQLCRRQGEAARTILAEVAPDWLAEMPWLNKPQQPPIPVKPHANSQARMLRELGELLEQWSRAFPLVLVLEDLHWSDKATLDALAFLARRKQPARWLMIASYRPEQSGDHQALTRISGDMRLRGLAKELALPLLSETAVSDYLRQRGADSDALVAAIYRRSEGLPFFMIRLAENLDSIGNDALESLPDDLQQLLEQQFQRLPKPARQLLNAAAVAGVAFSVPLLANLSGLTELETEQLCEILLRGRQFLGRAKTVGEYGFLHAYYHEYLYRRLPPLTKAALHRQTAYWLEANLQPGIDDALSALALHFERGGEFGKAVDYLQQAMEVARKRQASNEVMTLTQRALSLLERHGQDSVRNRQRQLEFYVQLGMAMRTLQGYGMDEQGRVYRRASVLAEGNGDVTALLPLIKASAYHHLVRLEVEPAERLAGQLLERAIQLQLPHFQLSANMILAGVSLNKADGTFPRYAEQARRFYQPELDAVLLSYSAQHPLASLGYLRAWHEWLQGHPQRALEIQQQTLAAIEKLDHPISHAFACLCMAVILQLRGEWRQLAAACERAKVLAETYDLESVARWNQIFQAWLQIKQGQIEPGLAALRRSVEHYLSTGSKGVFTFQMLAGLAEIALEHQQPKLAEYALQQARALMNSCDGGFLETEIYRLQGEWLLAQPQADHDAAEQLFLQALATADRQGARVLALRSAISLTRLHIRQGRRATALQPLREIYTEFKEGWDTEDLRLAAELMASCDAL